MADFLGGSSNDIDIDSAASAFPDISLDGMGDIPSTGGGSGGLPSAGVSGGGFSFDEFEGPPTPKETNVKVTGDDEISKFHNEFPDIQVPSSQPAPAPSFGGTTIAPKPQPSAFPILNQTIEDDEPEVIREWRERQQEEIQKRDQESKAKRQETLSRAEGTIDEFYENYARKKERNIRENKDQEEEFLAKMNSSLSTGTTWERICDTVELQNSQSKTIARAGPGTTDLTRFKEVLLRLRREGSSAPGAAGY